jgi:prolipoprotein diacylglyceryl transferase
VRFLSYADAAAPGILLAQAIGRLGNYFNQELYGGPTDQPWGLEIDAANRPPGLTDVATYHPTFLYEALWNVAVALVIVAIDRRLRLGHGRVLALYVALYCIGRAFVENLRIDQAHVLGDWRLNVWVSLALFVLAIAYFVIAGRRHPEREPSALRAGSDDDSSPPDRDETSVQSARSATP